MKTNIRGKKFGRLTAIKPTKKKCGSNVIWECRCDCGNITFVSTGNLGTGGVKSCGCLKGNKVDIKNERFGRLFVVCATKNRSAGGSVIWKCRCDCGNITFVPTDTLRGGFTVSCGCLQLETVTIHGKSQTPEFRIWNSMKQRCYNPNSTNYKYWGGRGIKVCKRWRKSFLNFLEDMGRRPFPELTLERIDNDDNYCWYNCKWATYNEQANNRRKKNFCTTN